MSRLIDRYRRCEACGSHHWLSQWPANHVEAQVERSALPKPMLALDTMDATWHPHTGEMIESKSHFRAITRASGGEEVGNEKQVDNRSVNMITDNDVYEAKQMVEQGYKPASDTVDLKGGWN